ncbi:MAG: TIM barrel protein [Anaerolineae bacterium]|nr:TIM barrel protein [Anaerolineae bacterium]
MKLGLVTYMVASQWDVPTLIVKCTALGYEGVELRTTHAHGVELSLTPQERAEVRARFADAPVALWGLGSTCAYHYADPDELARNIEETKAFVHLAADVGARGVKVRPNGFQEQAGISKEATLEQIGLAFRECGAYAADHGVELWMEVHGRGTSDPRHMHTILTVADHPNCAACWNSNPGEVDEDGSVRASFALLRPWVRSCHINRLADGDYPYRELFGLLETSGYGDRFTLAEIQDSSDRERLLKYYRALWRELTRP